MAFHPAPVAAECKNTSHSAQILLRRCSAAAVSASARLSRTAKPHTFDFRASETRCAPARKGRTHGKNSRCRHCYYREWKGCDTQQPLRRGNPVHRTLLRCNTLAAPSSNPSIDASFYWGWGGLSCQHTAPRSDPQGVIRCWIRRSSRINRGGRAVSCLSPATSPSRCSQRPTTASWDTRHACTGVRQSSPIYVP